MDTKKVKVLLRAIELGSLSKAADEFLYTPSAVSHILNSLEDEIGTKIVKRTYKGIEPAENSDEIIATLQQLLDAENHVEQLVFDKKKGKESINIATFSSVSKYVLPRVIKGFKEKFPQIDVNILVVGKLKDAYDKHLADIFIGEKNTVPEAEWEELLCDPYVAVFPSDYVFNEEKNTILREDLYDSTFIMARNSTLWKYVDESKIKEVISVDSHDDSSILQMVKAGMGATILPLLSVKNEDDVICKELEPAHSRVLGLIYSPADYKHKKTIRNFIEYIKTFSL